MFVGQDDFEVWQEEQTMRAFGLDITRRDGVSIVAVRGELDAYAARQLREQLAGLVEKGQHHIVTDLDEVEFLDSPGLGVLVGARTRLRVHDGDLALVCTRPRLRKLLTITGLDGVFRVHETTNEAVSAFQDIASTSRRQMASPMPDPGGW